MSISEATAKGGEEQQHAQTANPVKQGPMQVQSPTLCYDKDPLLTVDLQSVTPPSDHQEQFPTKDTWEQMEKASYPESHLPAPEETPDTDHEESLTTSSPKTHGVVTVGDAFTAPTTNRTPEHHISENDTLEMIVINVTSLTDANELLNSSLDVYQEGNLPVLQEDHTPSDHLQYVSETEPIYSSTSDVSREPEEATAGTVEVNLAVTTSPHVEEADVNSGEAENHPTEEGSGDKDPQNLTTQSSVSVDTFPTSELVSSNGSGKVFFQHVSIVLCIGFEYST